MPLPTIKKQQIFQGAFISVWSTTFLDKAGKERIWEWIQKRDSIVIFPITKEKNVVLIKNYRVPIEKYVIELPAGLLDHTNESIRDAVQRELLEETGYRAETFFALPPSSLAAGTSNNFSHYFIATKLTKTSHVYGDETEDMNVIEIPAHKLINYYLNNSDILFDIRILALYQVALSKGFLLKGE